MNNDSCVLFLLFTGPYIGPLASYQNSKMLLGICVPLKPHVKSISSHRTAELTGILEDHLLISTDWERIKHATLEDIKSPQGRRFQISVDRLFWHFPPLTVRQLFVIASLSYLASFLSHGGHCKLLITVFL